MHYPCRGVFLMRARISVFSLAICWSMYRLISASVIEHGHYVEVAFRPHGEAQAVPGCGEGEFYSCASGAGGDAGFFLSVHGNGDVALRVAAHYEFTEDFQLRIVFQRFQRPFYGAPGGRCRRPWRPDKCESWLSLHPKAHRKTCYFTTENPA